MADSGWIEKIGRSYQLEDQDASPFLYRYRSASTEYFLDEVKALERREIYLSAATDLNDPYDCRPEVRRVKQADFRRLIRKVGDGKYLSWRKERLRKEWVRNGKSPSSKAFSQNLKKSGLNDIKGMLDLDFSLISKMSEHYKSYDFRVACFSKREHHPLLWAYYADGYSGFCIKYEVSRTVVSETHPQIPLPVSYKKKRPVVTNLDIFQLTSQDIFDDIDVNRIIDAMMFSKSPDWSHEEEWRISLPPGERVGYYSFPSLIPLCIILGPRMRAKNIDSIKEETKLPLFRLELSGHSYEFVNVPVED